MASLNACQFIGNVGRDPEIKTTPSGATVASFSLAVNRRVGDGNGGYNDETEWVNCVAWNKTAEVVEKFVTKGKQIFVAGRMQTRSWEKDGVKHYRTEIVLNQYEGLILLGSRGDGGARPATDDQEEF